MALWQADFHFVIDASDLPADYRERFSAVLPLGQSWSTEIEQWGAEDSDRIDILRDTGEVPEVFCRFDLREWKPDLYVRFVECLRGIGGRLITPEDEEVELHHEAFEGALRSSSAARFVVNPRAYFEAFARRDEKR